MLVHWRSIKLLFKSKTRRLETHASKDQSAQRRVDQIHNPVVQEDAEDTKEEEDGGAHAQHAITGSEVKPGLWLDIYNEDIEFNILKKKWRFHSNR